MTYLVVDTCTERLLVGRRSTPGNNDRWINVDSRGQEGPANHGRDLLPAIEELLGGERPDAVGVALGPGSFTGVRIGLATAKGLAEGWGVPLLGLDNLAAMADAWRRLHPASSAVLTVIDARKNKFYGALYTQGEERIAPDDRSAEAWLEAIGLHWSGPVAASGYQGSHLVARLGDLWPSEWPVFDTLDWIPGLLDQAEAAYRARRFLPADAAPRYLRLSEAEENLRARSS